jgi:dTMP kinase
MTPEFPFIIYFEGVDKSGKTTQALRMLNHLTITFRTVEYVDLPNYNSATGREMRNELAKPEPNFLYYSILASANRYELIPKLEKLLKDNYTFVFNRSSLSNLVYGTANGLSPEYLAYLDLDFLRMFYPDHIFYLRITEDVLKERLDQRIWKDAYERNISFLMKVQNNYDKFMIYSHQFNITVIDASLSEDAIFERVKEESYRTYQYKVRKMEKEEQWNNYY